MAFVISVFDYEGKSDQGELTLKEGDLVRCDLSSKDPSGWWQGSVVSVSGNSPSSQTGRFPSNFVKQLPDAPSSLLLGPPSSHTVWAICQFDWPAPGPENASLVRGRSVEVWSRGSDWWSGVLLDGSPDVRDRRPLLFPSNFVELVPPVSCQIAVALHDFQDASSAPSSALILAKWDAVAVLKKGDDGWWFGVSQSGSSGVFPSNFVRLVPDSAPVSVAADAGHAKMVSDSSACLVVPPGSSSQKGAKLEVPEPLSRGKSGSFSEFLHEGSSSGDEGEGDRHEGSSSGADEGEGKSPVGSDAGDDSSTDGSEPLESPKEVDPAELATKGQAGAKKPASFLAFLDDEDIASPSATLQRSTASAAASDHPDEPESGREQFDVEVQSGKKDSGSEQSSEAESQLHEEDLESDTERRAATKVEPVDDEEEEEEEEERPRSMVSGDGGQEDQEKEEMREVEEDRRSVASGSVASATGSSRRDRRSARGTAMAWTTQSERVVESSRPERSRKAVLSLVGRDSTLSRTVKRLEDRVEEMRVASEVAERRREEAERLSRKNETLVAQLRNKLDREQRARAELEDTLWSAGTKLKAVSERVASLQSVQATADGLNALLARETKMKQALTRERDDLAHTVEELTAQCEDEHGRRVRAEDLAQRSEAVLRRLEIRLASLVERVRPSDKTPREGMAGGAERCLRELEGLVDGKISEMNSLRAEVVVRGKQIESLGLIQGEADRSKSKLYEQTLRRRELEKDSKKLQERTKLLTSEKKELQQANDALRAELSKAEESLAGVSELEAQVRALRRRCLAEISARKEAEAARSRSDRDLQCLKAGSVVLPVSN